ARHGHADPDPGPDRGRDRRARLAARRGRRRAGRRLHPDLRDRPGAAACQHPDLRAPRRRPHLPAGGAVPSARLMFRQTLLKTTVAGLLLAAGIAYGLTAGYYGRELLTEVAILAIL